MENSPTFVGDRGTDVNCGWVGELEDRRSRFLEAILS
jgi:hypothetical protein